FDRTRCAIQRFAEHPYTSLCTFRQRPPRLFLGTAGAVELSRQLDVRGGEPEPFAPDVMHMREDRDNRAGVAAGRLGSPGLGIKMAQNKLVHPFVDRIALKQGLAKLRRRKDGNLRHNSSLRT